MGLDPSAMRPRENYCAMKLPVITVLLLVITLITPEVVFTRIPFKAVGAENEELLELLLEAEELELNLSWRVQL